MPYLKVILELAQGDVIEKSGAICTVRPKKVVVSSSWGPLVVEDALQASSDCVE